MSRANRYYAPGLVWHIVALEHPCSKPTDVTRKNFCLNLQRTGDVGLVGCTKLKNVLAYV